MNWRRLFMLIMLLYILLQMVCRAMAILIFFYAEKDQITSGAYLKTLAILSILLKTKEAFL